MSTGTGLYGACRSTQCCLAVWSRWVESSTRLGGFKALKKTTEAPYTTKVNYRGPTSRGTTPVRFPCAAFAPSPPVPASEVRLYAPTPERDQGVTRYSSVFGFIGLPASFILPLHRRPRAERQPVARQPGRPQSTHRHNYASSAALPRVSVMAALSLSEHRVLAMRCTSRPPPSEARSRCWCPANSASSTGL